MVTATTWRAGGWATVAGGALLVVDFGVRLLSAGDPFEPVRVLAAAHDPG